MNMWDSKRAAPLTIFDPSTPLSHVRGKDKGLPLLHCSTQVPHCDVLCTKSSTGNREKLRAGFTPVLLSLSSVSLFTFLFVKHSVLVLWQGDARALEHVGVVSSTWTFHSNQTCAHAKEIEKMNTK